MRTLAMPLAGLLAFAGAARAAEVVQQLPWTQAPPGAVLVPAQSAGAGSALRVAPDAAGGVALLRIERPALRTATWALVGELRYEGVRGQAFLEMWSVFPDGGRYFSRTLAPAGPMAYVSGTSGWRPFVVPFFSRPEAPPPVALELNLVLAGRGSVEIGPLRLVQYAPGENPLAGPSGAWWNDRQAGWIGALGGTLVGLLGALLGVLGGRGRARRLVLGATAGLALLGALLLGAGGFALLRAQPYAVWYPLVLGGTLLLAVMGGGYRRLGARYRELELRRMSALDAR